MNRRAVIVGFVVVFVLGLSLGFNAALLLHRYFVPRPVAGGPPPGAPFPGGPPRGAPLLDGPPGPPLERLTMQLGLTPEQHDRILGHVERMRASQRAVRDSLRRAIESELTPEQRERWRAMQPRRPLDPGMDRGPWTRPDRVEPGAEGER